MSRPLHFTPDGLDEAVLMDDEMQQPDTTSTIRSPSSKTRSLSDGGGTPAGKLSASPFIVKGAKRASKDDHHIDARDMIQGLPVTPSRTGFPSRRLSLNMQAERETASPAPSPAASFTKPAPLSPKLDHSQIYASPTNILPRRSRGLDFSRAATSLHHSTLAEQSSPDSSPTTGGGGRAMNIPGRRSNDYGPAEQSSNSLWSVVGGNQERMPVSSSLGSSHPLVSDSSSSDDGDLMDEDMDDAYVTTPQINRSGSSGAASALGSPAMNSLTSFLQRQRPRKQPKKRHRGPLGLGFAQASAAAAAMSKSPPSRESPMAHPRRESISWQANQLHISGSEEERTGSDNVSGPAGTPGNKRQTIMRQVATRRGNLMPKTKNFARIKHALLEEGAPVESEVRREAEVIRQVRESDMDLEPRPPSTQTSPNLANQDTLDDIPGGEELAEPAETAHSGTFKHQAIRNSKGTKFWDSFSEASSIGARTTPPPAATMPRGSSSGISEDMNMDSPSLGTAATFAMAAGSGESATSRSDAPVPPNASASSHAGSASQTQPPLFSQQLQQQQQQQQQGPSAAEVTRRINGKRRRDEDFDPVSFKRRAVSPGMSVHNSPVAQSPLQREGAGWGSRPSSHGGDKADRAAGEGQRGGSGAPSENGSGSVGGGTPGTGGGGAMNRVNGGKGRVGFQGMTDTNDGLMRMSIE